MGRIAARGFVVPAEATDFDACAGAGASSADRDAERLSRADGWRIALRPAIAELFRVLVLTAGAFLLVLRGGRLVARVFFDAAFFGAGALFAEALLAVFFAVRAAFSAPALLGTTLLLAPVFFLAAVFFLLAVFLLAGVFFLLAVFLGGDFPPPLFLEEVFFLLAVFLGGDFPPPLFLAGVFFLAAVFFLVAAFLEADFAPVLALVAAFFLAGLAFLVVFLAAFFVTVLLTPRSSSLPRQTPSRWNNLPGTCFQLPAALPRP